MDLMIGILIGTLYGRNFDIINQRTYYDLQRVLSALSRTQFAANAYYVLEAIYIYFERKFAHKDIYTHDLLCTCNRRSCKPISINTYVRKIKATN